MLKSLSRRIGMSKKISLLEKIPDCFNSQLYKDVKSSCNPEYILTFLYRKNKEKLLFNTCDTCVNEDFFTKINSELGEFDIVNTHPILGVAYNQSSYSQVPLYRHLNPTEPQLTKALSDFLSENQKSCKAFVQAIFELLNENEKNITSLPTEGYTCRSEVFTNAVRNKENRRKRIDNIIMWNERALCIEVKFDAVIKNNDLKIYKKQMEKMTNEKPTTYVAISIYNIQYEIDKKKCSEWKNLLWADVLRTWEKILANNNSDEDVDLKRYRSSLWRKVLCIGENEDVD